MAQQPRYKSEVYVPIHKDNKSFEERQKNIWDEINKDLSSFGGDDRSRAMPSMFGDMHTRMDQRRKEWESEVDRMRKDFFRLKPNDTRRGSSENLLENRNIENVFMDDVKHGTGDKKFAVSFDVSQFTPEEINVRTQDQKLLVNAKHEEKGEGKNVSREYSRQVDVPSHVDPNKLQCTLSSDGVLQVEAPVPAPAYDRIRDSVPISPRETTHHEPTLGHETRITPGTYRSGPVITEQDGSRKLKIEVDIGKEFNAEDLSVKTVDRKLVLYARHEEKSAGRTSFREFSREIELPADVDPNSVSASMSDEGVLMIEAPISSYSQGSYTGKPGSTKEPQIFISLRK